jgi:hypothetical protein
LVGFKIEGASTFSGLNSSSNSTNSYSLNSQYYFSQNQSMRWFGGLGIGTYHSVYSSELFGQISSSHESREFGFYPRAGFDYKFLSFMIDWNIAAPSMADINSGNTIITRTKLRNSYLALKVYVVIGGGIKKSSL